MARAAARPSAAARVISLCRSRFSQDHRRRGPGVVLIDPVQVGPGTRFMASPVPISEQTGRLPLHHPTTADATPSSCVSLGSDTLDHLHECGLGDGADDSRGDPALWIDDQG
jgi:hypothetical protein